MAALDFPASPSNGQQFTGPGGVTWVYDLPGTKWVAATLAGGVYAPLVSPPFTGNPTAPTPAAGDADTSIATTAFVAASTATALTNVGRNFVHNSMFNIAQRGDGPFTAAGNYTADRWAVFFTGGTTTVSRQFISDVSRAAIGDETATSQLAHQMTGTAGAGDFYQVRQPIEGVYRLAGKTVTVSFWAIALSGTPKVGVNLGQNFGTGGSPSAFLHGTGQAVTISTAWARYNLTFAVPSVAGKTLGSNGDSSTNLNFWLSAGSGSSVPAGSIGAQSGTFTFWGVQLEIGTVATPLEKLDPVTQLQQCQRFYSTLSMVLVSSPVSVTAAQQVYSPVTLPTTMRAVPTFTVSGQAYTGASNFNVFNISTTNATAYVAATGGLIYATANLTFSADL